MEILIIIIFLQLVPPMALYYNYLTLSVFNTMCMQIQFNALIVRSCSISYGHPWHCVIRLQLLIYVLRSIILICLVCGCDAHRKLTDFFFQKST